LFGSQQGACLEECGDSRACQPSPQVGNGLLADLDISLTGIGSKHGPEELPLLIAQLPAQLPVGLLMTRAKGVKG
jgi:hypothetical protein